MKRTNLIFVTISMIALLMLCACSDDNVSSSSTISDSPTFSKYLAQFVSLGEKSLNFDGHVVAFNAGALSLKCEENMVSYVGEEERLVPLKSISEENIAECFPKTASLLKNKFSPDVKFYAVVVHTSANPQIAVLDKFTRDEIGYSIVNPKGECYLTDDGSLVIFLVADEDGVLENENIPFNVQTAYSESWTCNEKGHVLNSKIGGEWYSDSLL